MKGKALYLFLALLLPGLIFVFLKIFGRNEFNVAPLYQTTPPIAQGCAPAKLPYVVSDSVLSQLHFGKDSLVVIIYAETSADGEAQFIRVKDETKNDPIQLLDIKAPTKKDLSWKQCSFFLREPFNTVLVDYKGRIRGEYTMSDREEVDRLLTEITIILKQY